MDVQFLGRWQVDGIRKLVGVKYRLLNASHPRGDARLQHPLSGIRLSVSVF